MAAYLLAPRRGGGGPHHRPAGPGAGVSEPTVIRCAPGAGLPGVPAFQAALGQKPGAREGSLDYLGGFALRPRERMEDLPLKAVRTLRRHLEETLKSVPAGALEQAARVLAGANFIDIYGVENSCAPASDLLTKLTYLGPALPVSHRRLPPADWGGPSAAGGRGHCLLPLG